MASSRFLLILIFSAFGLLSLSEPLLYSHNLPAKKFQIETTRDFTYTFDDLSYNAYRSRLEVVKQTPVGCQFTNSLPQLKKRSSHAIDSTQTALALAFANNNAFVFYSDGTVDALYVHLDSYYKYYSISHKTTVSAPPSYSQQATSENTVAFITQGSTSTPVLNVLAENKVFTYSLPNFAHNISYS